MPDAAVARGQGDAAVGGLGGLGAGGGEGGQGGVGQDLDGAGAANRVFDAEGADKTPRPATGGAGEVRDEVFSDALPGEADGEGGGAPQASLRAVAGPERAQNERNAQARGLERVSQRRRGSSGSFSRPQP